MHRIVVSMWVTLDGYVAGPQDEMDWLAVDERMMEYEISLVTDAEGLLLGRSTHNDFASAWPQIARDDSETLENRTYAQRVDGMPKIVVSGSGEVTAWDNTSRIETIDTDTVTRLKNSGDGDLIVYGSLSVIDALKELDMIDEYQLLMHPTTIGEGKALFKSPTRLHLQSVEPFPSGVALMRYVPAGPSTS